MARLTLRGLTGPHVIDVKSVNEGENHEPIVTFLSSPTVTLPDGEVELDIYICKSRQYNGGKDKYLKGKKVHTITVTTPEQSTYIFE